MEDVKNKVIGKIKMKPVSKLGIGPMSKEVIESVFRYSQQNDVPLMLIASKNQIDWDGGYVNNWTTKQYADYIKKLKKAYPRAKVLICRDHCGPGYKNNDLKDVYKTIKCDIKNGFDLIHIDFCRYKGDREQILKESENAIKFARKLKPGIFIEVGTDENDGISLKNASTIEREIMFFKRVAPIHFYVCQTGSLVKEVGQVGKFNSNFLKNIKKISERYSVSLKEHNADYLESRDIVKRRNTIDAVNVAPQFGVIQTTLTLQKALAYGIDTTDFLEVSYQSRKWKKWIHKSSPENKYLCAIIAGHYNFTSGSYKKMYEKISRHENLRESIIAEIMKNISLYMDNL